MAKVLIISSNAKEREGIAAILGIWHQVSQVADGAEGLSQILNLCPELIVLADGMPAVDDVSLVKRVTSFTDAPVIVIESDSNPVHRVLNLIDGADIILTRPFSLGELIGRVIALLRLEEKR